MRASRGETRTSWIGRALLPTWDHQPKIVVFRGSPLHFTIVVLARHKYGYNVGSCGTYVNLANLSLPAMWRASGGAPGRALKQESNGSCVSKTITIWPFLYSSPGCAFLLAILTSSLFLFMSSCAHVFRRRPKPNHSFVNLQKEGTQRHLVGRKTKLGREGWRTKQFVGGG